MFSALFVVAASIENSSRPAAATLKILHASVFTSIVQDGNSAAGGWCFCAWQAGLCTAKGGCWAKEVFLRTLACWKTHASSQLMKSEARSKSGSKMGLGHWTFPEWWQRHKLWTQPNIPELCNIHNQFYLKRCQGDTNPSLQPLMRTSNYLIAQRQFEVSAAPGLSRAFFHHTKGVLSFHWN